jgi:tetratricopeptide (TPR) repeat protein
MTARNIITIIIFWVTIKTTTAQSAQYFYDQAIKQLDSLEKYKGTNYSQPVANLSYAVRKDSTFIDAYFQLAKLFFRTKNYPLAIRNLDSIILINPENSYALFLRGQIYCSIKKYQTLGCNDLNKSKELGNKEAQEFIDKYCK